MDIGGKRTPLNTPLLEAADGEGWSVRCGTHATPAQQGRLIGPLSEPSLSSASADPSASDGSAAGSATAAMGDGPAAGPATAAAGDGFAVTGLATASIAPAGLFRDAGFLRVSAASTAVPALAPAAAGATWPAAAANSWRCK